MNGYGKCMYVYICICIHTHTHIYSGILFSHKRKEILPFGSTWIDPEDIMLDIMTEINQSEKSARERQ